MDSAVIADVIMKYYIWTLVLVAALVLVLYVYFYPRAIDFFDNPDRKKNSSYPVEVQ